MTVAFLTNDFTGAFPYLTPGGCTWYRCTLPASTLNTRTAVGIPAWDPLRGFGIKDTTTTGVFGWKHVVLKLIMNRSTPRQIELAKQLGQRIIVDIDDYYEGLTEANAAYQITHPDNNKWMNRDNYQRVIEAADTLTVSTPFLYDHYSKQHPDVRMIRNGIAPWMFDNTRSKSDRKPVIGWTGAVNFRNNDLEQLREWLPDFLETHDLRFHHAGHQDNEPSFADITGINPQRFTQSPLVPLTHYSSVFTFDIGIVPLNDIPFNHAKSNIKGLEYAANGIPFVASDTPEYRTLHEGGIGLLARSPEEWINQLTLLLDRRYRRTTAAREYRIVERDWSIDARTEEWRNVFAT